MIVHMTQTSLGIYIEHMATDTIVQPNVLLSVYRPTYYFSLEFEVRVTLR